MSTQHRAPYMAWAKHRAPAAFDLSASNLLGCSIDDIAGARESLSLEGSNPDGYTPLVEAIAARYGVEPSRLMTASGCSGANLLAMAATLKPGDEVLLESPYYDPIAGTARLLGAGVNYFERRFEEGYQIDPGALARAFTPRTRLLVLTNPHNPSGVLLDDVSIAAAAAVAASHGARLLVDEVYLDIVNLLGDGPRHTPAAVLAHNAISTNSLTKSYGLNALRCGWAIGSADAAEGMRRARDVVDGIGPVPVDRISVLAFAQIAQLGARARALVSTNIAVFREWVADIDVLELPGPVRASVVFPRVTGVADTRDLAARLQAGHDVSVVPGHFFGEPRNIRLSLAGRTDVLREGLDRLARFLRG
ncbi:MAG: pyridoxal phosphate-dependent aminotransferase [Acidobacteriota bacterium]|nr:pyridoxal phosphate-dependent aminotransferase [Acidobacteriota bacterium]